MWVTLTRLSNSNKGKRNGKCELGEGAWVDWWDWKRNTEGVDYLKLEIEVHFVLH